MVAEAFSSELVGCSTKSTLDPEHRNTAGPSTSALIHFQATKWGQAHKYAQSKQNKQKKNYSHRGIFNFVGDLNRLKLQFASCKSYSHGKTILHEPHVDLRLNLHLLKMPEICFFFSLSLKKLDYSIFPDRPLFFVAGAVCVCSRCHLGGMSMWEHSHTSVWVQSHLLQHQQTGPTDQLKPD